MPNLAVILKGDKTTHGGTVAEGFEQVRYLDIPVAGVGNGVPCPLCKGTFPITEGTPQITYDL
ncbi:PAAR domain-containing protein [Rahnella selenatireducens]|uniref:PAAR domain-containing protein n=1 Tax=Rahnella selenatireducens TaxID=3389797 RepID=UPI0039692DF4